MKKNLEYGFGILFILIFISTQAVAAYQASNYGFDYGTGDPVLH